MKKSIKSNGLLITASNFRKFRDKFPNAEYNDLYKYYIEYLLTGDFGYPARLDSWSADNTAYHYQYFNHWFTIYKEDKELAYSWLD